MEGLHQSGMPGVWTGEGDESYARNSSWQDTITMNNFPALSEVLHKLVLPAAEEGPLIVVDLGCSASPNTIHLVTKVVQLLRDRYLSSGKAVPEFQGCFSDLPANDFNTLFQLITAEPRDFFFTGIPASCFGRLLPCSSVKVFTCTHTLHWLSQVPPAVLDPNSPAYNGSRMWLNGSSRETIKAFKEQSMRDFRNFLSARADELSPGGVLFCLFTGASGDFYTEPSLLRPLSDDQDLTGPGITMWRMMEHVLEEMVTEGIVSKDQRASFNFPFCALTQAEVEEVLADYAEAFIVEKLVTQTKPLTEKQLVDIQQNPSEALAKSVMSVVGPCLRDHLGEDLFCNFAGRCRFFISDDRVRENLTSTYVNNAMILSRK